jgi:hypothetical protein
LAILVKGGDENFLKVTFRGAAAVVQNMDYPTRYVLLPDNDDDPSTPVM